MTNENEETTKEQYKQAGRWTKEEHKRFLEGSNVFYSGLNLYGKNWKKIQAIVKTRNGSQIRSHAQKYFNKISEKSKVSEKQVDLNQMSIHSQSKPLILPSIQFCFSDKGIIGNHFVEPSYDQTSMDHGLFSRPMEEISNNKSALFIDLIQDSNKNKQVSFIKSYVDIQQVKSIMKQQKKENYIKKTSFVRFAKQIQEGQDKNIPKQNI